MEGCICRWCHEGTYEFRAPDDCSCHVKAPCAHCEGTRLTCTSCGDEPITFEEAEKERGREIARPDATCEAQSGRRQRLAQSQGGDTQDRDGSLNIDAVLEAEVAAESAIRAILLDLQIKTDRRVEWVKVEARDMIVTVNTIGR